MMTSQSYARLGDAARLRKAVAALAVLLLSACLFVPGKFDSRLLIEKGGTFDFAYRGEIVFLPLAEESAKQKPFEPRPCHENDGSATRECSSEELEQQRKDWEEEQARRTERKPREAREFAAMFGGIDPSSPEAGETLRRIMERQKGWKKVEYRGDGLFHVEYEARGRLDHEFAFPVIEGMRLANPFVTIVPRDDGTVRVEAPGFAAEGPLGPMLAGARAQGMVSKEDEDSPLRKIDGRFVVQTDGEVLANNTDEGLRKEKGWNMMHWRVGAAQADAPSALIRVTD